MSEAGDVPMVGPSGDEFALAPTGELAIRDFTVQKYEKSWGTSADQFTGHTTTVSAPVWVSDIYGALCHEVVKAA